MQYTLEHSIWIDRPSAEVFAFATSPAAWPMYVPGVMSASGSTPQAEKNGTFELTMTQFGQQMQMEGRYPEAESGRSFTALVELGSLSSRALTTFTEENGGTRVERVLKIANDAPNPFPESLIQDRGRRELELELANLKDLLEAGAAQMLQG